MVDPHYAVCILLKQPCYPQGTKTNSHFKKLNITERKYRYITMMEFPQHHAIIYDVLRCECLNINFKKQLFICSSWSD